MNRPWMPLYIADYLRDTSHLRAAESGAYLHLIMAYWVSGKLPNDDRQLATIAKMTDAQWRACRPTLAEFFGPDWSSHKRIDAELGKTKAISDTRSAAGSNGAAAKWGGSGNKLKRSQRLAAARALGTHTEEEWTALVAFCGGRCVRCGADETVKDHIVPIYQGGSDDIENLQPLCKSCNSAKGPENSDLRPDGWRTSVKAPGKTPGEREANACTLHTSQRKKKDAAPDGAHLETDLFRRGKQVLGENSGGLITNLLKAKSKNIALARSALEMAATKQDPREYIGAIIRGRDGPEDARARGDAW